MENSKKDVMPDDLLCPITHEIIIDPVIASDGHTYERVAIEEWFKTNDTSPFNIHLPHKYLNHSIDIKNRIHNFLKEHPQYINKQFFEDIKYGDLKVITKHLNLGVNLKSKDENGNTALHIAIIHDQKDLFTYLVEKDINIEEKNINGNTVMHLAAIKGYTEIIKLLIQMGANIKALNDAHERPPTLAKINGHLELSNQIDQWYYEKKLHIFLTPIKNELKIIRDENFILKQELNILNDKNNILKSELKQIGFLIFPKIIITP